MTALSALCDITSMRCTLNAIIPVVDEKSGALTDLKCDLVGQAWSMLFPMFTLDFCTL